MTTSTIDCAIVTVTYHCEDFIDDFLSSVEAQLNADISVHLFIVDNLSADQTVAKVRQYVDDHGLAEHVTILPQNKNLGFGTGCNAGVAAAKPFNPKYYWFLNPDTQIFSDTLPELIKFVEQNPKAGFVCSQLVDEQNQPRPSGFRFPSIISEMCGSFGLGVLDRLFKSKSISIPVSAEAQKADWLTGASFIVLAQAFDELKGFDETFFLYFEEVDLCYRASQLGVERWINPASKVYHIAGASTGITRAKKAIKRRPNYWFESRRHYYIKNKGYFYFAVADLVTIVGLSILKTRQFIQRKDSIDPPHLVWDYARNSLFLSPFGKK